MKRKKISAKVWASIMAAAMVMSTCPTAAFAVTADKVAADGTYTATRHVYRTIEDADDEWNEYDVDVTVSVKDGKISDITATPKNGYVEADNSSYFSKAYSKKNGIQTLLKGKDATEDTINGMVYGIRSYPYFQSHQRGSTGSNPGCPGSINRAGSVCADEHSIC